ncbi:MAG: C40 family peptidase [Paludibacter sp.]|nr:C40 family peptidase [Paludibacter sp.]
MKTYYLYIWVLALVFVGCNSTRQLQKRQIQQVYDRLGLQKEHNDNFALYNEAASWLHVRHLNGGLSPNGIDCSGLVYVIYKNVYGRKIERNSADILKKNCRTISKSRLREGDLVFFNSGSSRKTKKNINHVGIYLKDHKFLHTSTSRGVMISDMEEDFFRKSLVCCGRVK